LPRSAARAQERKDATAAAARLKESIAEARRLCTAGRLKAAREILGAALGAAPPDHVARELAAALDLDLGRDEEALAEAREALSRLDLRTARRIAAGLSLRRSDLGEAELLLNEVEARSERALLDSIDAERRVVLSPPRAGGGAAGRPVPPGESFLLRIENEGDWLVDPRPQLWIGSAAKRQADLRILAAIGARHAKIVRETSDGASRYRIVAEAGQSLSVNRTETADSVLKDGDVVALGRAVSMTFHRPGNAGDSACLKLHGDCVVHGCSRVLLFAESGRAGAMVVGGGDGALAALRATDERFEIFRSHEGDSAGALFIRSARGISVDGSGERAQVKGLAGVVYAAGTARFYLDPLAERA
jgi:hypothetical protein